MNSIEGGVFQHDDARLYTALVTQHDLQSVDMLSWPARSLELSPIEHVWDIIKRQLQHHPQPALTVSVLAEQVHEKNSFSSFFYIIHIILYILMLYLFLTPFKRRPSD